jgi:hypothetical protein
MTANPTARHKIQSRTHCRLGWEVSDLESTNDRTRGVLTTNAARKADSRVTPRTAGDKVAKKGQTCPPYTVSTIIAKM